MISITTWLALLIGATALLQAMTSFGLAMAFLQLRSIELRLKALKR